MCFFLDYNYRYIRIMKTSLITNNILNELRFVIQLFFMIARHGPLFSPNVKKGQRTREQV